MEEKVEQPSDGKKRTQSRSLDGWLDSSALLISNAIGDAAIGAELAKAGYDRGALLAGKALYETVVGLKQAQKKEYGESYGATEATARAREEAAAAYTRVLKIARVAFQNRTEARAAMMVDGARNRSLAGWLDQAGTFYSNLLKDDVSLIAMARFGYTKVKLEGEYAKVLDIARTRQAALRESGEALDATRARDLKVDELAHWVSDLRAVCKAVFADDPGKLKTLGIS